MSTAKIRAALETRLSLMLPKLATAYENAQFVPAQGTPYQRANLLSAEPENPEAGSGTFRRELGVFQVTLFYPLSKGPGAAEARADAIKAHFPRGLSLQNAGITVTIDRTAHVMPGFVDEDRWAVPVRISYFSNISS